MQVIFYDFVTENTTDAKFPRANHLSNEDFGKFNKMSEEDLLDLVRKVRYRTDCECTFEFQI
jgi:hypothetical protein